MNRDNSKLRKKNAKEASRSSAANPDSSRTDSAPATIMVDGVSVAIPAVLYESELLAMPPSRQDTASVLEPATPPGHPHTTPSPKEESAVLILNNALPCVETAIAETAPAKAADPVQQAAIPAAIDPLPAATAMDPGIQAAAPAMQAPAPCETACQPQRDCEQEFLAWLENTAPQLPPAPSPKQDKARNHFETGMPGGTRAPGLLNAHAAQHPNEPARGGNDEAPNRVFCQPAQQSCSGVAHPENPGSAFDIPPSSHEMAGPPPSVKGGFRFEVNADLVIYGATEPDATVKVNGCPVTLNEDGSFSFRLAFPDGPRELSIEALSASGEHRRKATLSFDRQTKME